MSSSKDVDTTSMDATSSLKRSRPGDSPQNLSQPKKTKKKGGCICPICLEVIQDSSKNKKGHDAIFCEGLCNSWLHRGCAGLPKSVFTSLVDSSDPFHCTHCQLKEHASTISEMKATIASLTKSITALQSSVKSLESNSEPVPIPNGSTATNDKPVNVSPTNKPPPSASYEDKKFNVVIYGIKESPPKTSKSDRLENDLQSITTEFSKVDLPIQASSVKDCFRLGKYKTDNPRPRPILIKFLRSTEATLALTKIASFKAPVRIKPDMTMEERKAESALLKERWSLIQLGFDKKRIKLRNSNIYVDNKLYGQYQNSELCRSDYNPPLPLMASTNQHPSSAAPATNK